MKLITARETETAYHFRVQMDESQPAEGANVFEATWGKEPPEGRTAAQYMADIRRELKLLAQHRRGQNDAGTPLPGEGQAL